MSSSARLWDIYVVALPVIVSSHRPRALNDSMRRFSSDYLCWILTSTRRGRPRTHTQAFAGHLALLSILAATCFINQTNLEVITCLRQIDTRVATHTESTCTVRTHAHKTLGGDWGGSARVLKEAEGDSCRRINALWLIKGIWSYYKQRQTYTQVRPFPMQHIATATVSTLDVLDASTETEK